MTITEEGEAVDAGIPSEILDQFFDARRRVSQTVGSTYTCRRILKGMLSRSVFLDGAVEQLYDPSVESISPELIRREITSWLDESRIFRTLDRTASSFVRMASINRKRRSNRKY